MEVDSDPFLGKRAENEAFCVPDYLSAFFKRFMLVFNFLKDVNILSIFHW